MDLHARLPSTRSKSLLRYRRTLRRTATHLAPELLDYDGPPNDYAAGVDYFLRYFLKQNRDPDRKVFHHVTCATDTKNIEVVFNACKDIILKANLEASGFM